MRCSFCGKSKDRVEKLIAGPGVFICDECVAICSDIVAKGPPGQRRRRWRWWSLRCWGARVDWGAEQAARRVVAVAEGRRESLA